MRFFYKRKLLLKISFFAAVIFVLLLLMVPQYLYWTDKFGWNVRNINDHQVQMGLWVKKNIPENSVIALNDIGAITFISDRKIIDIVGLVSPEVLKTTKGLGDRSTERDKALYDYFYAKKPDYIIIFPT